MLESSGHSGPPSLGRRTVAFEGFDVFAAPEGIVRVTMTSDEVTAVCPVTQQPDMYTVVVQYAPRSRCLESKSLKLYLQSFRNVGVFCEALAAKVAADVSRALGEAYTTVEVVQKSRGGVSIRAEASAGDPTVRVGRES